MTTIEPTLEQLRPREWCVSWRFKKGPALADGWADDHRDWTDGDQAEAHARALQALEEATSEIAHVTLASRMAPLPASEWVEIAEW